MAVVTQLYFQIVEEINYMFRSFWVCQYQVETRISGKTHTLQCGHQEWGNKKLFKDNNIKVLLILILLVINLKYCINWLLFVIETRCVLCVFRTDLCTEKTDVTPTARMFFPATNQAPLSTSLTSDVSNLILNSFTVNPKTGSTPTQTDRSTAVTILWHLVFFKYVP
jgi:hypothetical protein